MNKLQKIVLALLLCGSCLAQGQDASMRDVLEAEDRLDEVMEQRESDGGELDMSTPLSSLLLLKEALNARDYTRAAEFLDMRYLPEEMKDVDPALLLEQLRYVWSRQEILDIAAISDRAEGHANDGLPSYRDLLGEIELGSGTVPIYMQRVPDGKGGRVWKFSNATVARIPELWEGLGYGPAAAYLKDKLPEFQFMGMENWQVLFIAAALLLGWPVAGLFCLLLTRLLVTREGPFQDALARFLKYQFRLFLFIILLKFAATNLGLSLRSMILLQSTGIIYIAVIILLLGVVNLMQGYQERRLLQLGNEHYVALLSPVATVIKTLIIIVVALVWAGDAGYDMTTVIAGLGVGSLAVALAAQKTLENIIGAITIYTARPIKPGDFCRFGTTVGTVEEIGLRSTIIRTLNRTRVSIPNAVFSADEVENFTERDRIRYFRYIRLEIGSAEQLGRILNAIRGLIEPNEQVLPDTVSVRLDEIIDNTVHIRIDAGVATNDYQVFLELAEELNLRIIQIVHEEGGSFSGPGQQLTVRRGEAISSGSDDDIEQIIASQNSPHPLDAPGTGEPGPDDE